MKKKMNKRIVALLLTLLMIGGLIPQGVFAPIFASADVGDIFIDGNNDSHTVGTVITAKTYITTNGVYEINSAISGMTTPSTSTVAPYLDDYIIKVKTGVTAVIILNNATCISGRSPIILEPGANVTLVLADNSVNTFTCVGVASPNLTPQAAILVPPSATLTIRGQADNSGSLIAESGGYGAGIGGGVNQPAGDMIIEGGYVTATAREIGSNAYSGNGAGIGGGGGGTSIGGDLSSLTIRGNAVVIATSEKDGAGIGGGASNNALAGNGGTISISDNAIVTATSNGSGAGIGGGYSGGNSAGSGGIVTISGNAEITATSGAIASAPAGTGAGIGGGGSGSGIANVPTTSKGGNAGSGSTLTISDNAKVTAIGGPGGGAAIGGGGADSGTPGHSGDIKISGTPHIVAKAGGATALDIGAGSKTGGTFGAEGNITITSGSVHAFNNRTSTVKNGASYGNDVLSMFEVNASPNISFSVKASIGSYIYTAPGNTSGKAYVWVPTALPNTLELSKLPNTKIYTTPGNIDTVAIYADAENGHHFGTVAGIRWFRGMISDPTNYTGTAFDTAYAIALGGTNDAGSGVVSSPQPNDHTFQLVADKNAKYWIAVEYKDHTGTSTFIYKSIVVDNFYSPIEIFVRDEDDSGIIKDYEKIQAPGNAIYGVPYDFDETTPLSTIGSTGYDILSYIRNFFRPQTHWDLSLPIPPFINNTSMTIELDEDVKNDAYADATSDSTNRKYTAEYTRNPNWCKLTAVFVDPIGNPISINSSLTGEFWVPLDGPGFDSTSHNFRQNGGAYIPPNDGGTYDAKGWYISQTSHAVDISANVDIPSYYVTQDYFELFNPSLDFDSINGSGEGALKDSKILYIVFAAPAVRLVEHHYEYKNGVKTTDVVHPITNTIIEQTDTTYSKQSLMTIPDMVCVGYEVLSNDGLSELKPFVRYSLPTTDAPDKSQLGLVYAEILAADGIDIYDDEPIINFYYEKSEGGIPVSELAYLTTRWRGEIGGVPVSAQSAVHSVTRINRDIVRTNDGTANGDIDHKIAGEVSPNKWFYDQDHAQNAIKRQVQPTTAGEQIEIVFYYTFSTNGKYTDKEQYVTEKYRLTDGSVIAGSPDTVTKSFVDETYTKSAPEITGYVAVGVYRGEFISGVFNDSTTSFSFVRGSNTPNEVVTFIYEHAATLHIKHSAMTEESTELIFNESDIVDYDGKVLTLTAGTYPGWVLDKVELDGAEINSPYTVTLDRTNPQEIVFFYKEERTYSTITIKGVKDNISGTVLYSLPVRVLNDASAAQYDVSPSLLPALGPNWVLAPGEAAKLDDIDATSDVTVTLIYVSGLANVTIYAKEYGTSTDIIPPLVIQNVAVGSVFSYGSLSIPGYQLVDGSGANASPYFESIASVAATGNSITFYYLVASGNQVVIYRDAETLAEIGRTTETLVLNAATTMPVPTIANYSTTETAQTVTWTGSPMTDIVYNYTKNKVSLTLKAYDMSTGNQILDSGSLPISISVPNLRVLENYDYATNIPTLDALVPNTDYTLAAQGSTLYYVKTSANEAIVWFLPIQAGTVPVEIRVINDGMTYNPTNSATYTLLQSYNEPAASGETITLAAAQIPDLTALGFAYSASNSNLTATEGSGNIITVVYSDNRFKTTITNNLDTIEIVERTVVGNTILLYPPHKHGYVATRYQVNGGPILDITSSAGYPAGTATTIHFFYETVESVVNSTYVYITLNGVDSASNSLYSFSVRVPKSAAAYNGLTTADLPVLAPNWVLKSGEAAKLNNINVNANISITLEYETGLANVTIYAKLYNTTTDIITPIVVSNAVIGSSFSYNSMNLSGYQLVDGTTMNNISPYTETITSVAATGNTITFYYVRNSIVIPPTPPGPGPGPSPTPDPDPDPVDPRPPVSDKIRELLEVDDHVKYIQGYPDGSIKPDSHLTRAEVAMIFWRLLKDPAKNTAAAGTFSDVADGDWYAQAVNYLVSIDILTGYPDSTFMPNKSITRAEFATIVSRFDDLEANTTNPFTDVSENHWARRYIVSAYIKGWINGYPGYIFMPDRTITRAEAVKIVNYMLGRGIKRENIDTELHTRYPDLPIQHWAFAEMIEASIEHDYKRESDGYEIHI